MFDFFAKLLGFAEQAFGFLIHFIGSLFTGLSVLQSSLTFPVFLSAFLPNILGTAVICVVSISVVKFIIGR